MEGLLIESVRKHPVLYNVQILGYMDPKIRQEAWEDIGNSLEIPAEKAKDMWNKLRRCFCNAINRRQKNGQAARKRAPWKFEQNMTFLLPFLESRLAACYIDSELPLTSNSIVIDLKYPDNEGNKNVVEDSEDNFESEDNKLCLKTEKLEESGESDNSGSEVIEALNNIRKRKHVESTQEVVEIMKENTNLRRADCESKPKEPNFFSDLDETDMFFLSMSKMTKQLPRIDQSKIKLGLSKAVLKADLRYQERLEYLNTEHHQYSRPGSSHNYESHYSNLSSNENLA